MKAVEREYLATKFALHHLVSNPPVAGAQSVPQKMDIREASRTLAGTYLVRLFAEFEALLRDFWETTRTKPPPWQVRQLIDSIASHNRIDPDRRADVHAVRNNRNSLVHRNDPAADVLEIATARGYLCRYLSWLQIAIDR